jgi:hypothetical protein
VTFAAFLGLALYGSVCAGVFAIAARLHRLADGHGDSAGRTASAPTMAVLTERVPFRRVPSL